jgi:hypothetical protein
MKYLLLILVLMFGAACTIEQTNEEEKEDDMGRFGELDDGLGRLERHNKKEGWSASRTLTHKDLLKEVSLQVDFPTSKNYTAQFRLMGDLRNKKTQAEITWTVEGNQIRRVITVADGVSIQGSGQNVAIKIKDVSTANLIPGSSADYTALVVVAPGTRGSTSNPPTLAGGFFIVADANTQDVATPSDSGVISVAVTLGTGIPGTPIAQNSVMIAQLDSGGNVLARYDPRNYFWVPLHPGCSKITIINNSGAPITTSVEWGIDG